MEPEGLFLYLHVFDTCSYPVPDEPNLRSIGLYFKILLNIVNLSTSRSSKQSHPSVFPSKTLHKFIFFPTQATLFYHPNAM